MEQLRLHIYCLGKFELHYQVGARREQLPKPPTQKSQSLLAYLVHRRRRPQLRERLMAMFWGDRPDHRARRSLSTALWHIRRCFPQEDPIPGNASVVRFEFPGTVELDVETFVRRAKNDDAVALQAAIASYQGAFLPGFYDDWVIDERYRLQSLYEEALARLMVVAESQGRYDLALRTAQRLLKADTLREDAYRLLMRVYARLGRRNAALAEYRRCRETILDELGVAPMAETRELYESIAGGYFEGMGRAEHAAVTVLPTDLPTLSGQHPLDPILPDVLAGREAEMEFLFARWREAPMANVRLILVSGEAGVGKTHLLKSFAMQLQQDSVPILWGRCYEFERLLPYQPVAEALRPLLTGMGRQELRHLPPWVWAGLARLLPELPEQFEAPGEPEVRSKSAATTAADAGEDQPRLFHAVAHFLGLVATSVPLLIVLDDLHWASASTLALLHYLSRQLGQRPLLFIGAYRPEAIGAQHPLYPWQQTLRRDGLVRELRLERLPVAAVESWLVEMAGAQEAVRPLARRLHAETEGNPFFVVQMVKALFEIGAVTLVDSAWRGRFEQISRDTLPLPATIRQLIEGRIRRLAPDVQEALSLAAVLGQEFDFDMLNAVWQQGEEATLAALEALLRARLVDEGAGATERDYVFTHHKIREVVYDAIPRRRRQQRHAQAAETMVSLHQQDIDAWLGEVAFHFEQGQKLNEELTGEAIEYLRRAGEQAAAQFALSEAAIYFTRALALVADVNTSRLAAEATFRLLMARERVYDWQAERELQAKDLAVLEQLAQDLSERQRADVALRRGRYAEARGDYAAAIEAAERAVTLAERAKSTRRQAMGHLHHGRALLRQGHYRQAQSSLEEALALARTAHLPKIEADSLRSLGIASYNQGNFAQAKESYERALALYRALADRRNEGGTLSNLGLVLASEGELNPARRHYRRALRMFRETGDRRGEAIVLNNLGIIARRQGDVAAARAYYSEALGIYRAMGDRRGENIALNNLGISARNLGDYAEATSYHQRALQSIRDIGDRTAEGAVLLECAIDATHLGNYHDARSFYEQCLELCRQVGNQQRAAWATAYMALLALHVGDHDAAHNYSRQALATAQELDSRPILACALTHLGHTLAALKQFAEAADAYQQAMALHRELGQLHLSMEPLAGLSGVLLAQQDVAQAKAHVDEILEYLENHTLDGTEEPVRVYLTCYRVLHTLQDPRAPTLLQKAYDLLQARAENILDEDLRRSFLENVPAHRQLAILFAAGE